MHSLEPELGELHAAGVIDAEAASRSIALARRDVLSLFLELRIALYLAVLMITVGVGWVLKDNLDRIGPVSIIVVLASLATGCYATTVGSLRQQRERTLGGDYVLLLGALLVSADLGYAESQFHWFGQHWSWHLLLLAAWHAITAYLFASRLLLSVSLTSLAAWFGIDTHPEQLFNWHRSAAETGARPLLCAGVIFAWRELQRRAAKLPQLLPVFEQFAINLAYWGALAWCFTDGMRWPGLLLAIALSLWLIPRGLRSNQESYVVYGVAYTALAACVVMGIAIGEPLLGSLVLLAIVSGASLLLWRLHQQLRQDQASS
jgi:hypothetical protein